MQALSDGLRESTLRESVVSARKEARNQGIWILKGDPLVVIRTSAITHAIPLCENT